MLWNTLELLSPWLSTPQSRYWQASRGKCLAESSGSGTQSLHAWHKQKPHEECSSAQSYSPWSDRSSHPLCPLCRNAKKRKEKKKPQPAIHQSWKVLSSSGKMFNIQNNLDDFKSKPMNALYAFLHYVLEVDWWIGLLINWAILRKSKKCKHLFVGLALCSTQWQQHRARIIGSPCSCVLVGGTHGKQHKPNSTVHVWTTWTMLN